MKPRSTMVLLVLLCHKMKLPIIACTPSTAKHCKNLNFVCSGRTAPSYFFVPETNWQISRRIKPSGRQRKRQCRGWMALFVHGSCFDVSKLTW